MGKLILLLLFVGTIVGMPRAEPNDLSNGVFIVHVPPALEFTTGNAPWLCEKYQKCCAIDRCEDQITRIDTKGGVVWFVLAAWNEEKQWCATGFGFGEYDAQIFNFADFGPCYQVSGMHLPTPDWPGPNQGVVLAATEGPWRGNFVPVYYFTGYAYAEGVIPLAIEPLVIERAGTAACATPSGGAAAEHDAAALGALGLFTDGIAVCPPEDPPGEQPAGAGQDTTMLSTKDEKAGGPTEEGADEAEATQGASDAEDAPVSTSDKPE